MNIYYRDPEVFKRLKYSIYLFIILNKKILIFIVNDTLYGQNYNL